MVCSRRAYFPPAGGSKERGVLVLPLVVAMTIGQSPPYASDQQGLDFFVL